MMATCFRSPIPPLPAPHIVITLKSRNPVFHGQVPAPVLLSLKKLTIPFRTIPVFILSITFNALSARRKPHETHEILNHHNFKSTKIFKLHKKRYLILQSPDADTKRPFLLQTEHKILQIRTINTSVPYLPKCFRNRKIYNYPYRRHRFRHIIRTKIPSKYFGYSVKFIRRDESPSPVAVQRPA